MKTIISFLKNYPLFPYLLILFFCLHGSVENYGYLKLDEVLILFLSIFIIVLLGVFLCYFFLKDFLSASLIVFFIEVWYLFFGSFHDLMKEKTWLLFFSRYLILIPFLFALTLIWIILVYKRKFNLVKIGLYLNILLMIYCFVDATIISFKLAKFDTPKIPNTSNFDPGKLKAKPNVYFLLFDEYPGYKSLKDSFDFSNDKLYDSLKSMGFAILPTFANYNFTTYSMSSILNMGYISQFNFSTRVKEKEFQKRLDEIKNAQVFSIFKSMGYNIKNFSAFDLKDNPAIGINSSHLLIHKRLITDKIFHNRLIRDVGSGLIVGKFSIPAMKSDYFYENKKNNRIFENKLTEYISQNKIDPHFVYAHFFMPHGPIFFDSLGNNLSQNIVFNEDSFSDKKLFLDYLKYVNTKIMKLVNLINEKDKSAIVVIMSDHGYRGYKTVNDFKPYFDNICAVKFPQKNESALNNEKMSNVNFFRYLFNSQFNQQFHYLQDSSIMLKE